VITASDDGMIRSHDDARALLTYTVTGAKVRVWQRAFRYAEDRVLERSRSYEITVRPHGREEVAVLGSYHLPVNANDLARSARQQVESALAAR